MDKDFEPEKFSGADTLEKLKKGISSCEEGMVMICVVVFLILIAMFGYNIFYWLKFGYFLDMTPCATINLWCYSNTGYIGIDKIIFWFGDHHYFYSLLIGSLLIGGLLKLQISDYEDRIEKLKSK